MNSIATNSGAMVALQALNRTNDELSVVQKRVSTGMRVSDAKDDGAAYTVAQQVRADMGAITSANEQLGGSKGILDTTIAGLQKVSETMVQIKSVLGKIGDSRVTGEERAGYNLQFSALVNQVNRFIGDTTYNGSTLLTTDDLAGANITAIRNERGDSYTIGTTDGTTLTFDTAVNLTAANTAAAAPFAAALTAEEARAMLGSADDAGSLGANKLFTTVQTAVNNALNQYGSDSKYVDAQVSYNKQKLDALEGGIGALIDADLAKESARLQSLQIRQQLGTQSLSTANQAPQALLRLFQ
ncbi:flagellin [Falsiroseomonas sp. CW058]|uniref:flagellin N-terminal helical domain-containing protein n=1 Tax=Falsiroseomonas sp. CW058 TaxID=3388664 RepID=UPI003D311CE5